MRWIEVCKTSKLPARTHKKLPVASFCASETAETGRIANGCEQGDHVSRRKGAKAREACGPDRGKLSACQKVPERETDCYFLRRAKSNTKSTRGKPCDLGSNRRPSHYFDRFSSFRQVTGYVQATSSHSIDGNDLNRCELQALHKRICNFVQVHSGFFGKQ